MIPFLCAASLYIFDACDHAPSAFFTLNNPNTFSPVLKGHIWQTSKQSPCSLCNLSHWGTFFSLSQPKVSTPPQPKSHQCFPKMNALHHLNMHAIFPALNVVVFSPKAGWCSATDPLKSSPIPSRKTSVSWLVFVRVLISTYTQSLAFGLTECTLPMFLLYAPYVSPIHQDNFEF